jgi:hypothetical protein
VTEPKRCHWHKWTVWGKPFRIPDSAYVTSYQERSCIKCNMVTRRSL